MVHPRKMNPYAQIMGFDDLILSGGAVLTHDPLRMGWLESGPRARLGGAFVWLRQ